MVLGSKKGSKRGHYETFFAKNAKNGAPKVSCFWKLKKSFHEAFWPSQKRGGCNAERSPLNRLFLTKQNGGPKPKFPSKAQKTWDKWSTLFWVFVPQKSNFQRNFHDFNPFLHSWVHFWSKFQGIFQCKIDPQNFFYLHFEVKFTAKMHF